MKSVSTQVDLDAALAAGLDVRIEVPGLVARTYGTYCGRIDIAVPGSSVVAWGSSQPHVVARESSQPHVVAWESSQPHVVARESSQPHVVARESSQPHVEARESSQPHVVAWGSSQPHVVAWGSSQPHVVAWGSSQPHVVARESSQPHVEARESSQPHVEAKGTVQLSVSGSVKVAAALTVAIVVLAGSPTIEGGGFIQRVDRSTPEKWCDYYGVAVHCGMALVTKGVRANYRSAHGADYSPGSMPVAHTFDPVAECDSGLHFSPCASMTLEFDSEIAKFMVCPVALATMAVHPSGDYPGKCKAPRVDSPCWEVDRRGEPLTDADRAIRDAFFAEPAPAAKPKKKRATKKVGGK